MLGFESEVEIVETAGNGAECIEKAPLAAPDVLLMDVNMPDMDGITATQVLTAEMPDVAVIILSVEDDPEIVRAGAGGRGAGLPGQPATHDQMMEAIRQVHRLQQHQPQNQAERPGDDDPPRRHTRFARVTNETRSRSHSIWTAAARATSRPAYPSSIICSRRSPGIAASTSKSRRTATWR